jgi:hypothetical protein
MNTKAHLFKGLEDWIEVFKAGDHTDSVGRKVSFAEADLDQMVANHKLGAAPAVLGHPKHDDPAYGWTEGLKREGESLFAKFKDIAPAFAKGVESGAYRNRSVSVIKDKAHGWRVRHVGWLGAAAPAINGLKPVEFAGDEAEALEFAAPGYSLVWGLESLAKMLRGLRDNMIAKDGIEATDAVLPAWQIDSAMEAAAQARKEYQEAMPANPLFNQPTGETMSFTQEDLDRAATEAETRAKAEAKVLADVQEAKFAANTAELATIKAEAMKARHQAQIDGWKAAGKLLPAEEAGLAEFMAGIEGGAELQFTASDNKAAKAAPADWFANFMSQRKALIKLGVQAAAPAPAGSELDTTDSNAIANAASEFVAAEAKAGRTVSVAAAVQHVMSTASQA